MPFSSLTSIINHYQNEQNYRPFPLFFQQHRDQEAKGQKVKLELQVL